MRNLGSWVSGVLFSCQIERRGEEIGTWVMRNLGSHG
jgi:hypothetical protein